MEKYFWTHIDAHLNPHGLSAANLRWDVWEKEKQRKKEAEELAWVLTHPVLRGPNGERVAGPAFEPPVPRPPRKP